jgi:hypothetical protein
MIGVGKTRRNCGRNCRMRAFRRRQRELRFCLRMPLTLTHTGASGLFADDAGNYWLMLPGAFDPRRIEAPPPAPFSATVEATIDFHKVL